MTNDEWDAYSTKIREREIPPGDIFTLRMLLSVLNYLERSGLPTLTREVIDAEILRHPSLSPSALKAVRRRRAKDEGTLKEWINQFDRRKEKGS